MKKHWSRGNSSFQKAAVMYGDNGTKSCSARAKKKACGGKLAWSFLRLSLSANDAAIEFVAADKENKGLWDVQFRCADECSCSCSCAVMPISILPASA
eukprot:scaffold3482_cov72-Skeletonema_dohrnii-CCMP3373.AAC.1